MVSGEMDKGVDRPHFGRVTMIRDPSLTQYPITPLCFAMSIDTP